MTAEETGLHAGLTGTRRPFGRARRGDGAPTARGMTAGDATGPAVCAGSSGRVLITQVVVRVSVAELGWAS